MIEEQGEIVGFYGMSILVPQAQLDYLYMDPSYQKRGLGRLLWKHAIEVAKNLSVTEVILDADPHAEKFYHQMGAILIGLQPSGSIPGRMLPLMSYKVQ